MAQQSTTTHATHAAAAVVTSPHAIGPNAYATATLAASWNNSRSPMTVESATQRILCLEGAVGGWAVRGVFFF